MYSNLNTASDPAAPPPKPTLVTVIFLSLLITLLVGSGVTLIVQGNEKKQSEDGFSWFLCGGLLVFLGVSTAVFAAVNFLKKES